MPSQNNIPTVKQCWKRVLGDACSAEAEGAHIFAYQREISSRSRYESDVYGRHRLTWLATESCDDYGSDTWVAALKENLDFETRWRALLRPTSINHPLILPEHSFIPQKQCADIWKRAQRVRTDRDDLCKIDGLKDRFRDEHRRDGVWF